ncbi:MAG TPA: hypothetical protein VFQ54_08110 [Thermomicrobiales bacterium]|nr:hypothetical protein [Thermomicrobiales bacterium]
MAVRPGGGERRSCRAAIFMFLILALGLPQIASAQSSAEISVSVVPPSGGALSATLVSSSFAVVNHPPERSNRIVKGTIKVLVEDSTGSGRPWNVRASAAANLVSDDGEAIPATGLVLTVPASNGLTRSTNVGNIPTPSHVIVFDTGKPISLLACAKGNCQGAFVVTFSATLSVPDWAPVGTYSSTLVLEIAAEPDLS